MASGQAGFRPVGPLSMYITKLGSDFDVSSQGPEAISRFMINPCLIQLSSFVGYVINPGSKRALCLLLLRGAGYLVVPLRMSLMSQGPLLDCL